MKTWYLATFKWSDSGVYCTNLVLTDSEKRQRNTTQSTKWYLSALLTNGRLTVTEAEVVRWLSFEQTIKSVTSGTSSPT